MCRLSYSGSSAGRLSVGRRSARSSSRGCPARTTATRASTSLPAASAPRAPAAGATRASVGRYQFQSPSSFIVAGRSTPRTIVASIRIAAASPTPNCLKIRIEGSRRSEKTRDHHDRGARDDAGRRLDPVRDRLVHARAAVEGLADPAEDEDVVVHREAEQDHEQQQRDDRARSRRCSLKPSRPLPIAVLEDEHEHAVGGGDREQVEQRSP